MSRHSGTTKRIFAEVGVGVSIIALTIGGNLYHKHTVRQQRHDRIVRIAQHKRYLKHLRHVRLWRPIHEAHGKPTATELSHITLNNPWHSSLIYVNHNKSTLNPKSWKYDHVDFAHKDSLGRVSSPATAYLARGNATGDALRKKQKVKPVGWHQHRYDGDWLLNRGHLIAYSLTKDFNFKGRYTNHVIGNQNDPGNLFTETAFTNQQLQYAFETRIRIELEKNKRIIYRAQPIFRGNELMARGIHLQAISTDRKFQFNVYLFNAQPGIKFNYRIGQAVPDEHYQFSLPNHLIKQSEKLDNNDKNMNWQRRIMHLYQNGIITRQQAIFDEQLLLGGYVIKY